MYIYIYIHSVYHVYTHHTYNFINPSDSTASTVGPSLVTMAYAGLKELVLFEARATLLQLSVQARAAGARHTSLFSECVSICHHTFKQVDEETCVCVWYDIYIYMIGYDVMWYDMIWIKYQSQCKYKNHYHSMSVMRFVNLCLLFPAFRAQSKQPQQECHWPLSSGQQPTRIHQDIIMSNPD